ncbi:MAG: hypothetical protein SNJ84_03820 [Verrucomicrobiia bacterium]
MIADGNQLIHEIRESLTGFWQKTLQIEWEQGRAHFAYPLMLPDGVQIVFELHPVALRSAILSDGGRILSRLTGEGLNIDTQALGNLMADKLAFYEIERDGFELLRGVSLPVEAVDIQIYAEGLLAIAQLINRHEPEAVEESVVRQSVERIFAARHLQPKRNHPLEGRLEKAIRVSYFLESGHGLAMEVVDRKTNLHGYMQQWGWRWKDLQAAQPAIKRAMIYDPDRQDWDETALEIGRSVCDLFCPYHDSSAISETIEAASL